MADTKTPPISETRRGYVRPEAGRFDLGQGRKPLFVLNWVGTKANRVMYTFIKILIVVLLVLAAADWVAGRA